jgi:hypothetical protein
VHPPAELLCAEWVVSGQGSSSESQRFSIWSGLVNEINTNFLAFLGETVYAYSEKFQLLFIVTTTLEHRVRGACDGVEDYYVCGA